MVMARSGDTIGGNVFGALVDSTGQPILNKGTPVVSHNPDANNILTAYNNKMYAVTHFESPNPATAYLSEVEQDSAGKLTYTKTQSIDFSKFGGLWIPCAGSISPWGSHLGSEEYEPDGRAFFTSTTSKQNITSIDGTRYEVLNFLNPDLVNMATYLGKDPSKWSTGDDAVKDGLNPYNYGWPWELKVKSDGTPDLQKLYGVGRMSYEQLTGEPQPFLT
jgi:secreted PhoX family phosphatase